MLQQLLQLFITNAVKHIAYVHTEQNKKKEMKKGISFFLFLLYKRLWSCIEEEP